MSFRESDDSGDVRNSAFSGSESAAQDREPTMRYARFRGEEYVNVRDLAGRLREQGYPHVADWLAQSSYGLVTNEKTISVRR